MSQLETSNFVHDALLFVTVIDQESFTKAGELLGLSKSIVSKRIRRLEAHLELQLLHRSTRKLTLTEAGRQLYERFSRVKTDIHHIQNHITEHKDEPSGELRVHAPVSFGTKYILPVLDAFMSAYPKVDVKLFLGRQFAHLIESRMDVSIHIGKLKDSNLYVKKLLSSSLVVCASPKYCEKNGYPKRPSDLLEHNCLRYHSPSEGNDWYFKEKGQYALVQVKGNFSASSANTLEAAAISGLGIVMLPEYVVQEEIKAGRLVRLLDDFCSSHVDISLVFTEREYAAPKVKSFIDFVSSYVANV